MDIHTTSPRTPPLSSAAWGPALEESESPRERELRVLVSSPSDVPGTGGSPVTPRTPLSASSVKEPRRITRVKSAQSRSRELQKRTRDANLSPTAAEPGVTEFLRVKVGRAIGIGVWSRVYEGRLLGEDNESDEDAFADDGYITDIVKKTQFRSQRLVAVKLPRSRFAEKVLQHEARILSRSMSAGSLASEYVVTFYGCDITTFGLVLEYLPAPRLGEVMKAFMEAPENLYAMVRHLVRGLEHLHQENIVHGDIKPENIFIRCTVRAQQDTTQVEGGELVYTPLYGDFSASRLGTSDSMPSPSAGTYDFMAPEQFTASTEEGSYPTKLSDVFALGVTLLVATAGRSPYADAGSSAARMHMAAQGRPLDVLAAADPRVFQAIEEAGLAKWVGPALIRNPSDRVSATDWTKELDRSR